MGLFEDKIILTNKGGAIRKPSAGSAMVAGALGLGALGYKGYQAYQNKKKDKDAKEFLSQSGADPFLLHMGDPQEALKIYGQHQMSEREHARSRAESLSDRDLAFQRDMQKIIYEKGSDYANNVALAIQEQNADLQKMEAESKYRKEEMKYSSDLNHENDLLDEQRLRKARKEMADNIRKNGWIYRLTPQQSEGVAQTYESGDSELAGGFLKYSYAPPKSPASKKSEGPSLNEMFGALQSLPSPKQ